MIEINLVPDIKQELLRARSIRSAVVSGAIITTIVAVGVVVALSVYVFGVQGLRGLAADNSIKDGAAKLATVEDLSKVLTIQNQLTKMSALNDEKVINSRAFDLVRAIIPPAPSDVKISSLTIDGDAETIAFEGQSPDYPSFEALKKTIAAANVRYNEGDELRDVILASNLSISDVSYGEDATGKKVLRYTISFTYAAEIFSPKVNNPTIVLINGGNVTDSYLGIPKSIFTEPAKIIEEAQ